MNTPRRAAALAAALTLTLSVLTTLAPSASADHGNNGTIKVDEQAFDAGPGEDGPGAPNSNDPQIDCAGRIEWYGFDAGQQTADVIFEVWSPTANTGAAGAPTTKEYSDFAGVNGDGPGGTELDGFLNFDLTSLLSSYQPQPEQGYHVKVTVHTTSSQGNDVKHKVFWIAPCQSEQSATTGGLSVDKALEGDDLPLETTAFAFTVDCGSHDLNGEEAAGDDASFTLTAAQDAEPFSGIPTGTSCTVTETGAQNADATRWTVGTGTPTVGSSVTVVIGNATTIAVLATNVFNKSLVIPSTGALSIDKLLDGDAQPVPGTQFTFLVECVDGTTAVDLNGADVAGTALSVTVTAAQAARVISDIPTGSVCSVTETDDRDATQTSWMVNGLRTVEDGDAVEGLTIGDGTTVAVAATNIFDGDVAGVLTERLPVVAPAVLAPSAQGTSVAPRAAGEVLGATQARSLPRTGGEAMRLATAGLGMLLLGVGLTVGARRPAAT